MAPRRSSSRARGGAASASASSAFVNVGLVLVLYVAASTGLPIYYHWRAHGVVNPVQAALSFFLGLNSLICMWEIALGLHITHIASEFSALQKVYGKDRLGAVLAFFYTPVSISSLLSLKFWSKVWSTYSLYDPSYSNRESYGFFVDVSNGWTTLLPSLLFFYSMTFPAPLSLTPRVLGCVGLVKFYVEFHGTCVYFLSFFFNGRQRNKGVTEVALFVGLSNGLWFFFPLIGIYASYSLIQTNTFAVFGR